MTYEQAKRQYPSVPDNIVRWAVDNIPNERQVRRGLYQLEVGMDPMVGIDRIDDVEAPMAR